MESFSLSTSRYPSLSLSSLSLSFSLPDGHSRSPSGDTHRSSEDVPQSEWSRPEGDSEISHGAASDWSALCVPSTSLDPPICVCPSTVSMGVSLPWENLSMVTVSAGRRGDSRRGGMVHERTRVFCHHRREYCSCEANHCGSTASNCPSQ